MDYFVHEAPLDHSFQKERRDLASKGSLGRRRRPSRYDIRSSGVVINLNGSFESDSEKISNCVSETCVTECLRNRSQRDASASSVSKATKDQVKRKREASKSAVLIQTWERRSLTEKAQKVQSTLCCPRDSKSLHDATVTAQKETHLKSAPEEHNMLESCYFSNCCASRFDHGVMEAHKLLHEDCLERERGKCQSELRVDSKSRDKTNETSAKINNEPEWISLSKKLCAKFIESHLEPIDSDIKRTRQDINHASHGKSKVEQSVPACTPNKTASNGCKEPQWVLLSKKLCTKFLEEHIENCKENAGPKSAEQVQREVKVKEKFPKISTDCRAQQKEEPEWISLSRKLRAKFIEGHLDDPDKVSFDSQLNASDLEENFSVPTLAQKYLNYRNQTQTSRQSETVDEIYGSSQNLSRECVGVNDVRRPLTTKDKELSRSMPHISTKSKLQNEGDKSIRCEDKLLMHDSDLECHQNARHSETISSRKTIRVSVDHVVDSEESELSCVNHNRAEKQATYDRVSETNYKQRTENHHNGNVYTENDRSFLKSFDDSEGSDFTHDNRVKNSANSFRSSSDEGDRDQFIQREGISSDNRAVKKGRSSPIIYIENVAVESRSLDQGKFYRQCYSDDDTFQTIDLNSNAESAESLEIKESKYSEQYVKGHTGEAKEFDDYNTASRITNHNSQSECLVIKSHALDSVEDFGKSTSSPFSVANSQKLNGVEAFGSYENCRIQYSASQTDKAITNSAHDAKKYVKSNDKVSHRQDGNDDREVMFCDKNREMNNDLVLSRIRQFSGQSGATKNTCSGRTVSYDSNGELYESKDRSERKKCEQINPEAHRKDGSLENQNIFPEEHLGQCFVRSVDGKAIQLTEKSLLDDRGNHTKLMVRAEEPQKKENHQENKRKSQEEELPKCQNKSKNYDRLEDANFLNNNNNNNLLNAATTNSSDHQKVIVSFNVKTHERKDGHGGYSFSDETSRLPNASVVKKSKDHTVCSGNYKYTAQKEVNHSKTSASKVFKITNFEKPPVKESAIFYHVCGDETPEKAEATENQQGFSKVNSADSCNPNINVGISEQCVGENKGFIGSNNVPNQPMTSGDVNKGFTGSNNLPNQPMISGDVNKGFTGSNNLPNQPVASGDVNIETLDEAKMKSSSKQRDIRNRLRPLGYLSKISNSNHETNSDKSVAKRTDSTKSHYIDYKDEHLYMNYSQEYGKIRAKDSYKQNRCHASAPDLSKESRKDEENLTLSKAESQQEIKVENTCGILDLDTIIRIACSSGLPEPPSPSETVSKHQPVSSKESFSQTSPMVPVKHCNGENYFYAPDDQDYLKDSTSTSFCPSDSECSSWVMTRNNSYVINESSSMNESDISDCSLSVKCGYLSSCSNQNTMEARGRSSSESGSYMQMQNVSKVKNFNFKEVEKSGGTVTPCETTDGAKISKPSCPATPESLRHLFQMPSKPLFPSTLHTSRVFISKEPPPIYASLSQSSSSSLKQNKREEKSQKTDRSSSLKIRDIAQGIILTFRRFQNISSSTKPRHVSPSRYVDVSHLAESHRQVPKEWFSAGNNPSVNFLNGATKKTGHSVFPANRPVRSQSESGGCAVNLRGQQNIYSNAENVRLGKKSCSRSSSDLSSNPEKARTGNALETDGRPEKHKKGDKALDGRGKKSNKSRSQQNCSKSRAKRPESRNVTSISRKVQQMADGTLYLVTTVSGDSSVPGFYSDSVNTNEDSSGGVRQTKAAGESNC